MERRHGQRDMAVPGEVDGRRDASTEAAVRHAAASRATGVGRSRTSETGKVASAKLPRPYRAGSSTCRPRRGDRPRRRRHASTCRRARDRCADPDHATIALRHPRALRHARTRRAPSTRMYEAEWPDMEGLVISNMTLELPVAMSTEKTSFVDLAALAPRLDRVARGPSPMLAPEARWTSAGSGPTSSIDTGDAKGFVDTEWVGQRLAIGDERRDPRRPTTRPGA